MSSIVIGTLYGQMSFMCLLILGVICFRFTAKATALEAFDVHAKWRGMVTLRNNVRWNVLRHT